MLEKLPGGKYRKKVNIIPEDQSQQVMQAAGQERDADLQVCTTSYIYGLGPEFKS